MVAPQRTHASADSVTTRLLACAAIFAIGATSFLVNTTSAGLKDPVPDWVIISVPFLKWFWVTFITASFADAGIRFAGLLPHVTYSTGWASYIRRVALASVGGLPRFVVLDQLGGVPFSFWYGLVLVAIDLAIIENCSLSYRYRVMFWIIASAIVVPWGIPALSTRWPDPGWGRLRQL